MTSDPLAVLRQVFAAGRFDEARAHALQRVAAAPDDGEAWLLCGLAGLLGGKLDGTEAALERARALLPHDPRPLAALGEIALRRADAARAEPLLADAVRRAPRWAEPAMRLGDSLRGLQRHADAALAYLRAAHAEPPAPAAVTSLLQCAQALSASEPPAIAEPLLPPTLPAISVVFARGVDTVLRDEVVAALAPAPCEAIVADPALARAAAWSDGIARAGGEIVVLWRADAVGLAGPLLGRLLDELMVSDLVGVLGTSWLAGPTLDWSGPAYEHGWLVERGADGALAATLRGLEWPAARGVQALDSPLLAFRREQASRLVFDTTVLDGEHLVELDTSYRAYREGLRVAVRTDLNLLCDATGDEAAAAWSRERFVSKYGLARPFQRRGSAPPRVAIADAEHARSAFGWLASWCVDRSRFTWEHLAA